MRLVVLLLASGCIGLDSVPGKPDSAGDTGAPPDDTGVALGDLEVGLATIDFGAVPVGEYRSEDLALANIGDGVVRVEATLDGDGAFSISESNLAVPGGAESVLVVGFTPYADGAYRADLTLTTDGGESVTIPVLGTGGDDPGPDDTGDTDPEPGSGALVVTPSTYDYGQVDLGGSESWSFTVSNTGDADLMVSNIVPGDSAFAVTGGTIRLPQVLSPGASKTVDITFSPTAERAYSTEVDIQSDDPDSPHTWLSLEGEGADLCSICSGLVSVDTGGDPYSVTDFYSLLGTADRRTWTIRNAGDMDLEVRDVYVNNDVLAPCGTFTLNFGGATTLRAGSSTTFQISYQATDVCLDVPQSAFDMNVVHVLTDDPSQPNYVIDVGGSRII